MAPCLSLNLFLRTPRPGRTAATGADSTQETTQDSPAFSVNGDQPSDLTFSTVVYHIQAALPAGEQDREVRHNCDYIDVSERCVALPRPMRSFLVNFVVEDAARAQVEGRQLSGTLCSPCWKRVEDAIRDLVFVRVDPATGEHVVARPPSFYKASMHVPQAVASRLTGNAESDWGTILEAFVAQDHGMNISILIERVLLVSKYDLREVRRLLLKMVRHPSKGFHSRF
ncbi:hypothetical protein PG997_006921 [Apiospora hydei]|uniref:Uncharacterized protein n=1 Tax=Apiospora hydei TaxID=1337664 RepID=A0ABR1WQ31_9PEZI